MRVHGAWSHSDLVALPTHRNSQKYGLKYYEFSLSSVHTLQIESANVKKIFSLLTLRLLEIKSKKNHKTKRNRSNTTQNVACAYKQAVQCESKKKTTSLFIVPLFASKMFVNLSFSSTTKIGFRKKRFIFARI